MEQLIVMMVLMKTTTTAKDVNHPSFSVQQVACASTVIGDVMATKIAKMDQMK